LKKNNLFFVVIHKITRSGKTEVWQFGGFLFLAAAIFFSCSSSKQTEQNNFDIRDVINSINRSGENIKSVKGNGNISLESPDGGNSGNFKINILKPDSVHLSITGPFGINVAKALITKDTFFFHDAFNNVMVTGKTTKKNIGELLRVNLSFEDIMALLSCAPNFLRESGIVPQVDMNFQDNEAVLIYKNENDIIKYFINLENKYISRRIVYSGSGKILKEEKYQNYYRKNDIWIPRSIQLSLPIEGQSLSLFFEMQDLNSDDLNFSFNIPKDTKVVHWR
jgi:outer membrane biogenesis lipoprotein LolB